MAMSPPSLTQRIFAAIKWGFVAFSAVDRPAVKNEADRGLASYSQLIPDGHVGLVSR